MKNIEEKYLQYLKQAMIHGSILISKRGDIAYYDKKSKEFLLRFKRDDDYSPVTFDFQYLSTFEFSENQDERLKIPRRIYFDTTFKIGDVIRNLKTNEIFINEFVEEINGLIAIGTIKKDKPNKGCKTLYYIEENQLELWQPHKDELCIFHNGDLPCTLGYINTGYKQTKGQYTCKGIFGDFKFCEPFNGTHTLNLKKQ